jgi:hypothetical protein
MAKEKKNINLELWNQVCETNPAITKRVNTRGGFTSIDAQAQIKRATELWGPFGKDWGLKCLDFTIISTTLDNVGVSLEAIFYYPANRDPDNKDAFNLFEFEIASDMVYKPNDDCFKKLQTDCITKALSRLGFNSDVFEGKYDDNRYVAEMNKKYNKATDKPVEKQTASKDKEKIILQAIFDGYFKDCPAGFVVDMAKLKTVILNTYSKLPTKDASVSKVLQEIPIDDVIVPNDFIEGID